MTFGAAFSSFALFAALGGASLHATPVETVVRGKHVFEQWCSACHADRKRMPGTIAIGQIYQGGKPAVIEKWTDLAPEITRVIVRNGSGAMPRFRKTEISDAELNDLAIYLASKKSNLSK